MDHRDGLKLWHLSSHAAPEISEALIVGRERIDLAWFYKMAAYIGINAAKDVFEQRDASGLTN
jgi:hypothetical protein